MEPRGIEPYPALAGPRSTVELWPRHGHDRDGITAGHPHFQLRIRPPTTTPRRQPTTQPQPYPRNREPTTASTSNSASRPAASRNDPTDHCPGWRVPQPPRGLQVHCPRRSMWRYGRDTTRANPHSPHPRPNLRDTSSRSSPATAFYSQQSAHSAPPPRDFGRERL